MEENYFLLVLDSNIDNLLQSHFRVFRPLMLEIYPKPLNLNPLPARSGLCFASGPKGWVSGFVVLRPFKVVTATEFKGV